MLFEGKNISKTCLFKIFQDHDHYNTINHYRLDKELWELLDRDTCIEANICEYIKTFQSNLRMLENLQIIHL